MKRPQLSNKTFALVMTLALGAGLCHAAEPEGEKPLVITIENHVFHPAEIHIPADKKAVLLIKNLDSTSEEFESGALKIEKVIPAHGEGLIHVRETPHGHYTFVGEYHEKTARGVLIAD